MSFNQYEKALLNSLVTPEEIAVTFDDIGGLSDIIDELREAVILPLTEPELFAAHLSLIQSPKGYYSTSTRMWEDNVGQGNRQRKWCLFLLIRMSSIMDKWYGESNKITDAIFSLANKLQPCIIFIDEIDSF